MLPEEVIYKILEASDIKDLVSELKEQLPPFKFEFWRRLPIGRYTHCFYHNGNEKSPLLDAIRLVMQTGKSYEESAQFLAQKYGVSLEPDPELVKYADSLQSTRAKQYRAFKKQKRKVG
jgi:hypothetical protein